jgi:hypothetical protein
MNVGTVLKRGKVILIDAFDALSTVYPESRIRIGKVFGKPTKRE